MEMSKYTPSRLAGYVKFDIEGVTHPSLGSNPVNVSGKYRRLKPKMFRPEVDPNVILSIAKTLRAWVYDCGFSENYFERYSMLSLATTAVTFGIYWLPNQPLDSIEMEYFLLYLILTWIIDDVMEEAWFDGRMHKGNIDTLRYAHKVYIDTIRRKTVKLPLPEYSHYPEFHDIYNLTKAFAHLGEFLVGVNNYKEAIEPFAAALQENFEGNEWFTCSRIDQQYSRETYHSWRVRNAGSDCVLEVTIFINRIRIPWSIRKHPAFLRLVAIKMNITQQINDIVGVKKDFAYKGGDPDNEIVYRVTQRGDNIHEAIADTCDLMEQELQDIALIKQAVVDIFGVDNDLLHYFDMLDVHIDGQNQSYVDNPRYKCNRGDVSLAREDNDEAFPTKMDLRLPTSTVGGRYMLQNWSIVKKRLAKEMES